MACVKVFLTGDLLKAIDQEAARAATSRSALIQTALQGYLDARQREREADERHRAMEEACKRMDRVAVKLGSWDSTRVIRHARDSRAPKPGRR